MANKWLQKRDAGQAWIERTNPLAGLSVREAQAVFDAARGGDTQRLHWIFHEIENANPTLMTCVERRGAALASLPWRVSALPSADPALGAEQKDAAERFLAGVGNLDEAVEHLGLAFFRGFSYAQPIWEADGSVRTISLLESWLFVRLGGRLHFCPACDGRLDHAVEVTPEAGLVGVRRARAIDYPALAVHIRAAVGERDWGRFLERIALPKPAVVMAPDATDDDRAKYVAAAEDTEDGKVSVWPNGTAIQDFMGGSRGQDPFSAFVRHQEETVVRLATGGTLGSIAEAGSGTLAGGAQADVWREIVARDAAMVGAALMRGLVRPFVARAFPGRACAVEFSLDAAKRPSALDAANVAATLRTAGWRVDRAELEAATGFTLERDDAALERGGAGTFFASAREVEKGKRGKAEKSREDEEVEKGKGGKAEKSREDEEVEKWKGGKEEKSREDEATPRADALANALDEAVYAAMAEAVAKELERQADATERVPPRPGETASAREYKREADGKFSETDHPRDFAPGRNPDSAETQAAEIGKGGKALRKCLAEKADVRNAVARSDIGPIDFVYGDSSAGLAHIAERHGEGVLERLPEVLVRGEAGATYQQGQKLNVRHGPYTATLRLDRDGKNDKWVLTLFEKDGED